MCSILSNSAGDNVGDKEQRVPNVVNNPIGGISRFFTPLVTNMKDMFRGATKLFVNLENWNVLSVNDNANFKNDNNHITPPSFNKVNRTSRNNLLEAMFHLFTDPEGYESTYGHVSDWILSSAITDLSDLTNTDVLQLAADITLSPAELESMEHNITTFDQSLSDGMYHESQILQGCLKDLSHLPMGLALKTKRKIG